ncbi:MAG: putative zinc-binding protein [Candidatus Bathyarchaeota archaeon]|nr:putative zinc-binding protein [Candidatus Bathyarchaeota archaeon]
MMAIVKNKVGIVSCSGEELPEGTVSRIATRLVLEKLRPDETVTICLPLFLAGGEDERSFTRVYPTITVDGCEKQCAKVGTSKYSGKPAATLLVTDILKKHPELELASRDELTPEETIVVDLMVEEIVKKVDEILYQQKRMGN